MKPITAASKLNVEVTSDNKCSFCRGSICCTYITHPIDTPRSKKDFEYLLWQVSHQNVQAYRDDDGWYLQVMTPCTHLQPDGRCGIYDKRPQICRDHSNDYCEYDEPAETGYELFFDSYEKLNRYCKKRFKRWDC